VTHKSKGRGIANYQSILKAINPTPKLDIAASQTLDPTQEAPASLDSTT